MVNGTKQFGEPTHSLHFNDVLCFVVCGERNAILLKSSFLLKGSPTVVKSRTPYLKSHLKSLKSLKFQNLKSRTVETVISKFLYISTSNHVKIGRTISNKPLVKVTNHETS